MNMILLFASDVIRTNGGVKISGKRLAHIKKILTKGIGDTVYIGMENGKKGTGTITALTQTYAELQTQWTQNPPAPLPGTLILALPRPKVFRRILQGIVEMGIKKLIILHCYRVEKSYWHSPKLSQQAIREACIKGLEQAGDTIMPEIHLQKHFKPFVEDTLPQLAAGTQKIIAHPYADQVCPGIIQGPVILAIGPEGGFIPYEIQKLEKAGFKPMHMGDRILRVETAVTALLSKIQT